MSANDDVQALAGIYWPTYEPPPEERQKMERIHQFGMEVHCTLHSEILGYNDVHSLMHDYCEDTGKDPQAEAKALGFESFREFLQSDYMKDLVICKNIGDRITYEAAPRKNMDHIRQEQWKSYQYLCQKRMKREGYCDSRRVRPQLLNVAKIDVGWPGMWDNASAQNNGANTDMDEEFGIKRCESRTKSQIINDVDQTVLDKSQHDNAKSIPQEWDLAESQERIDAKCNANMPSTSSGIKHFLQQKMIESSIEDDDPLGIREFEDFEGKQQSAPAATQKFSQKKIIENSIEDDDPLGIREFEAFEGKQQSTSSGIKHFSQQKMIESSIEDDDPLGIREFEAFEGKQQSVPGAAQKFSQQKIIENSIDDDDPLGIREFESCKGNVQSQQQEDCSKNGNTHEDSDNDPLGIKEFMATEGELRVVESDTPVETESTESSPDTPQYYAGEKPEKATHDLDNDEDPLGINGFLASKSK
ncbi:hypothetical protein DdX_03979 [Ditylenchus destructor]|uniref:DUF7515 domain-containing protein n=1 Tax=Ditylenchus destructor TaxID=166010 RepID=A0AAD4R5C0_9BILA|nr:hypothetical protein DdX_03979 [Ditylenchus destructor]